MCRFAFTTAECCMVFDRPTGARLIGFFYICLFFFSLIGPVIEVNRYRRIQNAAKDDEVISQTNDTKVITGHDSVYGVMSEYGHVGTVGFEVSMVFLIISLLVGVLVNVGMVWGVHLKFCWLLVPWLVYQMFLIFIHFTVPILAIYYNNYYNDYGFAVEESKASVLLAFFPTILGLLGIYFWLVVRRLFDDFDKPPASPSKKASTPMVVVVTNNQVAPDSPVKVVTEPAKVVD